MTSTSSMKKYAIVIDVSPSEQISGNPDAVKCMALLMGLYSPKSFDQVGSQFAANPLPLKKWSKGSKAYRQKFVRHAAAVVTGGQVLCGVNKASEAAILKNGRRTVEELIGPFPQAESVSLKGKPRIRMGGYKVDGVTVPPYDVLEDDLCILGWLVESLASYLAMCDQINEASCTLDVIIDRLPNEQGGDTYHKATLLKLLLDKATGGRGKVMGVADPAMETQRELFVDNLAGLAAQLHAKPMCPLAKMIKVESLRIFSIDRSTLD
jgi:hypothetical protein